MPDGPALPRGAQIEFPHPNEDARAKILRIHSRKMTLAPDVNFEELGRSTDDFNAAQVCASLRGAGRFGQPIRARTAVRLCAVLAVRVDACRSPGCKPTLPYGDDVNASHVCRAPAHHTRAHAELPW
jgi:hypothetical protein